MTILLGTVRHPILGQLLTPDREPGEREAAPRETGGAQLEQAIAAEQQAV